MQEGSGAFSTRVQAAIGLTPLAARVPPTERAGSEEVIYAAEGGYKLRPRAPPQPFEPSEPSEPSEP